MHAPVRHKGESLIALLIGLVIALISVSAMLRAYAMMVGVSIPATQSADRDAQAMSALLTAQIEMQQAGYGMDAGTTNVFVSTDRRRIMWRYRPTVGAPAPVCAGLDIDTAGIRYLPPRACGAGFDVNNVPAWTSAAQLLASPTVFYDPGLDAGGNAIERRDFDLQNALFRATPGQNCGPFGITGANRTLVTLTDEAREPDYVVLATCLTNPNS